MTSGAGAATSGHPARTRAGYLGGGAGFFNVMRLYPSLGIGVVVMGNATTYDIDAVARLGLTHTS